MTKLNGHRHLHSLYELKDRYEEKLANAGKKSAKAQDDSSTRSKAKAVAAQTDPLVGTHKDFSRMLRLPYDEKDKMPRVVITLEFS